MKKRRQFRFCFLKALAVKLVLAAAAQLQPLKAFAVDLYALYTGPCEYKAGAIIDVSEDQITLLDLTGQFHTVQMSAVRGMAVYRVQENPFAAIPMPASNEKLYRVQVAGEDLFYAYATSFVDNLVLFMDTSGQIHVLEEQHIVSLRLGVEKLPPRAPPLKFRSTVLVPPMEKLKCHHADPLREEKKETRYVVSEQMYSDQMRIGTRLAQLREGYRELNALAERSEFYPRPMVFDQETRLGFLGKRGDYKNTVYSLHSGAWANFPLYFEMSSGKPYRFQSYGSIGQRSIPLLPSVEPFGAAYTAFKSHLIHGMLVANLDALAAGKPVFSNQISTLGAWRKKIFMDQSFNHMTLLGVDYQDYSFSFGSYFPVFVWGRDDELREYLPGSPGMVLRGALNWERLGIEVVSFFLDTKDQLHLKDDDYLYAERLGGDGPEELKRFSFDYVPHKAEMGVYTLRVNVSAEPWERYRFEFSQIYQQARYKEQALLRDQPVDVETTLPSEEIEVDRNGRMVSNYVEQMDLSSRVGLRLQLGQWVALKGEVYYSQLSTQAKLQGRSTTTKETSNDALWRYLGAFELLL